MSCELHVAVNCYQRVMMLFFSLQSFIAGIQDVIEPTFTFVLAWALGTAMQVSII